MTQSNGFDRKARPGSTEDRPAAERLAATDQRCRQMLASATPPAAMAAAAIAPARGPQVLVPDFTVTRGGIRHRDGGHWVALSPIKAMVARAQLRHEAKGTDTPFIPPFDPAQVQVAEDYAALVEWREGSPMRGQSLDRGRGAASGNPFIDSYIQNGLWLEELRSRIGQGFALRPQRNMDRGNARRPITTRAAVDLLCLIGQDLSHILQRFGWPPNGQTRKDLRSAICGALDRMQGYKDA